MSFGVNQLRYSRGLSYFDNSLHAEADLIKKVQPADLVGAKIFIYRFNNVGLHQRQPRASSPCHCCKHLLNETGASRVVYLDSANKLAYSKPQHMRRLSGHPHMLTKNFLSNLKAGDSKKFLPQMY